MSCVTSGTIANVNVLCCVTTATVNLLFAVSAGAAYTAYLCGGFSILTKVWIVHSLEA